MRCCRDRWLVLTIGLLVAASARADGPTLSYAPTPDQVLAGGTDCFSAPGNPAFEIDFAGACTPGSPCDITATNTNNGGPGFTDLTFLSCDAQVSSGDGVVDVTVPGGAVQFQTSGGQPVPPSADVSVSCTSGTQLTKARVCCTESRGGTTVLPFWDVRCPAGGAPSYGSTPAPGTPLTISTTVNVQGTTTVTVNNNAGTANLIVTPSGLANELAVSPSAQTMIGVGMSQLFTITCDSTTPVSTQQQLSFATNDSAHNPATYMVTCNVAAAPSPAMSITPQPPGPLSITTVQPANGSTSFNVANTGTATLTLSFAGLSGPLSVSAPSSVPAGSNTNFTVSCAGNAPGSFNGVLTVSSNDPDHPSEDLNVSCNVTAPQFSASPPPPGPIALGTTSGAPVSGGFSVSNNGNATLSISNVIEQTPGGPITVSPTSASIAPGNSQPFTVSCNSASAGSFVDSVSFSTNDPSLPTSAYDLTCDVSAAPAPEFSSTPAAPGPLTITTNPNVTATTTFTVQNVGTAQLTISGVTEGTPGGVVTVTPSATPINLAPNATQVFTVSCTSAATGTFNDTVTLATNDTTGGESSVLFNLTCNVNAIPMVPEYNSTPAAPGPLTLNATQPNSASTTLTVSNTGNANLVVSSITGLVAPLSVSPTSFTIAQNTSKAFVVSCAGGTPGTFTGTMTVNTNDSDEGAVAYNVSCTIAQAPPVFSFLSPAQSATVGTALAVTLTGPVATDSAPSGVITFRNLAPLGGATLATRASRPASPFAISPSGTVSAAPNGGQGSYTVSCSPKIVGTVSTTLLLDTNATNIDPARYPFNCTGTAGPEFSSSPAASANAYTFTISKPTPPATSSTSAILRVSNIGATTLRVFAASGLSGNLSVIPPSGFPISIAASAFADFTVRCTATTAGVFTQTLVLSTNDVSESNVSYGITCKVFPPLASRRALHAVLSTSQFNEFIFKDGFENPP